MVTVKGRVLENTGLPSPIFGLVARSGKSNSEDYA